MVALHYIREQATGAAPAAPQQPAPQQPAPKEAPKGGPRRLSAELRARSFPLAACAALPSGRVPLAAMFTAFRDV